MKKANIALTVLLLMSTGMDMTKTVQAITTESVVDEAVIDQSSTEVLSKENDTGESMTEESVDESSAEQVDTTTDIKEVTDSSSESTNDLEAEAASVEKRTISFQTTPEYPFITDDNQDSVEKILEKNSDEFVTLDDVPTFGYSADNLRINGWKNVDTGKVYTTAELLKLPLSENLTLSAVFKDPSYLATFGLNDLPPLPSDSKIKVISTIFDNAVGTGPKYSSDGKTLLINPAIKSQLGAIWSKKKLNMTKDFQFKSYFYLGNSGTSGADGITFTLQNDPRGSKALANAGQGLGAYSVYRKSDYIKNAISVEFDTYYNNGTKDPMDGDLDKNGNRGHIAVVTPSSDNNRRNQHSAVTYPSEPLSNGKWRTVVFNWDADKQDLSYELVGVGSATYHIADVQKQFGGNFVNWGFTSSTGSYFQDNAVAITDVPSSVSHVATLKNETQGESDYVKSIEGAPGDTVAINDHLILDESSPHFGQDAVITIDLTGIEYIEDSLYMDDVKIPNENITYENNQLSLTLGKVVESMAETADLNFKAKVADADPGTNLSYYFTYSEDGVSSDSNYIYLNVPLILDKVINVNYVDIDTNQEIAKHTEIKGKIGERYTATPKEIDGYILESDSGNTEGVLAKDSEDVTFYYRKGVLTLKEVPSVFDFKNNKISNKVQKIWPVRTGQIVVSDERGSKSPGWRLNVKEIEALHNDTTTLNEIFNWSNGTNEAVINENEVTVKEAHKLGDFEVTSEWSEQENVGINVQIPIAKQLKGQYQGKLEWILADTP